MIWLLPLLPLALLVLAFELYALARRKGWRLTERLVTVAGGLVDIFCNYTYFRVLGPWPWAGPAKARTVTARVTALAREALASIAAGEAPRWQAAWGYALAVGYLNVRDPGHCRLVND